MQTVVLHFVKNLVNLGIIDSHLNVIPGVEISARAALKTITKTKLTPHKSAKEGRFVCPSCWSLLGQSQKYQKCLQSFWSVTHETSYVASKTTSRGSQEAASCTPSPIATSTPKPAVSFQPAIISYMTLLNILRW